MLTALLRNHVEYNVTRYDFAGEVAIDLQRVGNHCKDIAAELHKVKADIKDRTPPSSTLQLNQRNAALSDQLQQTAARFAADTRRMSNGILSAPLLKCWFVTDWIVISISTQYSSIQANICQHTHPVKADALPP